MKMLIQLNELTMDLGSLARVTVRLSVDLEAGNSGWQTGLAGCSEKESF